MTFCCQPELRDAQAKETTQAISPPPYRHYQRSKVLQACLDLDADALDWVLKALHQKRPQCLHQITRANLSASGVHDSRERVLKTPKAPFESESAFSCFSVEACKSPKVAIAGEPKLEEIKGAKTLNGLDDATPAIQEDFDYLFSTKTSQLEDITAFDFETPTLVHERDIANHGKSSIFKPKVQFDCPIYYAAEDGDGVEVAIIRIGYLERKSVVQYTTSDRSAKAGTKYHAAAGAAVFERGESSKTIKLEIIDDGAWDATLEFALDLLDEGLENAELARFQRSCRVKIIDDDTFPSNRYRPEILRGDLKNVSQTMLLFDYIF